MSSYADDRVQSRGSWNNFNYTLRLEKERFFPCQEILGRNVIWIGAENPRERNESRVKLAWIRISSRHELQLVISRPASTVVPGEMSAPKNTWRCLTREAYDTGKQLTWILKQPSHAVAFEAVFSSDRLMMILLTTTGQWNRKRERVGLHAAWLIIFRHSSVNCTSRHEASLSSKRRRLLGRGNAGRAVKKTCCIACS